MSTAAGASPQAFELTTAGDYLTLGPDQRYAVVSQRFPEWLLTEPIEFPRDHSTYGWACRVSGCDAAMATTETRQLCVQHARACTRARITAGDAVGLEKFLASAQPSRSHRIGWARARRRPCRIDGCPREIDVDGCCKTHGSSLRRARVRAGFREILWAASQSPMPLADACWIEGCVHDGSLRRILACEPRNLCGTHAQQFDRWLQSPTATLSSWADFLVFEPLVVSVMDPESRGLLSLAKLPGSLQREIRYALHRHANTARRTQWRPATIQAVADALADSGVQSLADPVVAELTADHYNIPAERRIWLDLPAAARSLSCTPESAKAAGWFDPVLIGGAPFTGSQGNRVKPWDLTSVSQRWLRDLLWEHLADEAQLPSGKQACYTTISYRVGAVALLSRMLEQNRPDHGNNPEALGKSDAEAVKRTWDLWFHEQIPLPIVSVHTNREP
ncbi:hypothetical protein ABIA39_007472 [Nocardia sp. GAS34]|uniref:hypothetical protein n=1 Tax=unclassified Nocardia TaxID=2637762 RepID=UPI003D1D9FD1